MATSTSTGPSTSPKNTAAFTRPATPLASSRHPHQSLQLTCTRDVSLDLDHLPRLRQLGLRTLGPLGHLGDLRVAPIARLTPAWPAKLLQRAVAALLAPVRQVRGVQPLAAQQLADLPRRRARVRPGEGSPACTSR